MGQNSTDRYRVCAVGDKLIATGPGECFETGKVYTVVAVYDGKMDLECALLDTTVAGVQIDDPNLQSIATDPVIMVAEGTNPKYAWRQYFVITDERCVWVEMLPALFSGWKFHRIGVQSGDDWRGCTRDQIVAYKLAHCAPIAMAPDLGGFRERLLAVAEAGKLPGGAE